MIINKIPHRNNKELSVSEIPATGLIPPTYGWQPQSTDNITIGTRFNWINCTGTLAGDNYRLLCQDNYGNSVIIYCGNSIVINGVHYSFIPNKFYKFSNILEVVGMGTYASLASYDVAMDAYLKFAEVIGTTYRGTAKSIEVGQTFNYIQFKATDADNYVSVLTQDNQGRYGIIEFKEGYVYVHGYFRLAVSQNDFVHFYNNQKIVAVYSGTTEISIYDEVEFYIPDAPEDLTIQSCKNWIPTDLITPAVGATFQYIIIKGYGYGYTEIKDETANNGLVISAYPYNSKVGGVGVFYNGNAYVFGTSDLPKIIKLPQPITLSNDAEIQSSANGHIRLASDALFVPGISIADSSEYVAQSYTQAAADAEIRYIYIDSTNNHTCDLKYDQYYNINISPYASNGTKFVIGNYSNSGYTSGKVFVLPKVLKLPHDGLTIQSNVNVNMKFAKKANDDE